MAGINKFDGKDRRRQRLRNHIAKDLGSPKYRQRVVPDGRLKKSEDYLFDAEQNGYDSETYRSNF